MNSRLEMSISTILGVREPVSNGNIRNATSRTESLPGDEVLKTKAQVLIVDDEPSIRRALRTTLALLGFATMEAPTGEEALAMLHADHCAVVLLDIDMPGMGGIETCRELRRKYPSIQIVILTIRDREEDRVKGLDAGANAYLTKPYSVRELLAIIGPRTSV
jgi:two-component system, OmpR family, KDP operon response regulator KdpE